MTAAACRSKRLVERETIRPATDQTAKPEKLRLAAEAGQQFLRMLEHAAAVA